jgi:hypothetical protein
LIVGTWILGSKRALWLWILVFGSFLKKFLIICNCGTSCKAALRRYTFQRIWELSQVDSDISSSIEPIRRRG